MNCIIKNNKNMCDTLDEMDISDMVMIAYTDLKGERGSTSPLSGSSRVSNT